MNLCPILFDNFSQIFREIIETAIAHSMNNEIHNNDRHNNMGGDQSYATTEQTNKQYTNNDESSLQITFEMGNNNTKMYLIMHLVERNEMRTGDGDREGERGIRRKKTLRIESLIWSFS